MPFIMNAQSYKETFDSNSLEWTECGYKNGIGTAIIENGVMTIESKGENKAAGAILSALSGTAVKAGENTYFETHCYAPLDIIKPFEVRTLVNIKTLAEDKLVGLLFNYKDNGNFYVFSFNDDFIQFRRYEDGYLVGTIMQGMKFGKKRKQDMEWTLISDGQTLTFKVDGIKVMSVRYMPLSYSGIGFYTFGNQSLTVDEIEFIQ